MVPSVEQNCRQSQIEEMCYITFYNQPPIDFDKIRSLGSFKKVAKNVPLWWIKWLQELQI
jgi:hypothetical protein